MAQLSLLNSKLHALFTLIVLSLIIYLGSLIYSVEELESQLLETQKQTLFNKQFTSYVPIHSVTAESESVLTLRNIHPTKSLTLDHIELVNSDGHAIQTLEITRPRLEKLALIDINVSLPTNTINS